MQKDKLLANLVLVQKLSNNNLQKNYKKDLIKTSNMIYNLFINKERENKLRSILV